VQTKIIETSMNPTWSRFKKKINHRPMRKKEETKSFTWYTSRILGKSGPVDPSFHPMINANQKQAQRCSRSAVFCFLLWRFKDLVSEFIIVSFCCTEMFSKGGRLEQWHVVWRIFESAVLGGLEIVCDSWMPCSSSASYFLCVTRVSCIFTMRGA